MKKALALVLALVLALSMAVSAFAATLVELTPAPATGDGKIDVEIVSAYDEATVYYTTKAGTYYIALDNQDYKDITLSTNGIISAELVKYDPAKMNVHGELNPTYHITYAGEKVDVKPSDILYSTTVGLLAEGDTIIGKTPSGGTMIGSLSAKSIEAIKAGEKLEDVLAKNLWFWNSLGVIEIKDEDGNVISTTKDWRFGDVAALDGNYTYEEAVAYAEELNDINKVTLYGVGLNQYVNIIKVTVAENYSAAYKEGTLKIDAVLNKVPVSATLTIVSDVSIWEYEMVKWAAANYEDGKALVCGDKGYSDYDAYRYGYDFGDDKYDIPELRTIDDAAVVSTTAFRAITGKSVAVKCDKMTVEVKNVVAGQKGVNFKHYGVDVVDANKDGKAEAIEFGFLGDQVILGDYTITVDTGYNWFTLREAFGEKVEEDDIISYYVLKNGKVVKELKVDYMTANIYQPVVLELDGSNSTLGAYEIVIDVPAVEGETNPNTGAESVVGVVAALAVVSVATAAAVSLKK